MQGHHAGPIASRAGNKTPTLLNQLWGNSLNKSLQIICLGNNDRMGHMDCHVNNVT